LKRIVASGIVCVLGVYVAMNVTPAGAGPAKGGKQMQLGNFSVSLTVKDLEASRAFYEKLGFHVSGGNGKTYSIMQNDTATIGLYQGMFDKNILTFNPGWNRDKETLPDFDDVRDIQKTLKDKGIKLTNTADNATDGPAYITFEDPDGNQFLIDQHVPRPKK